MQEFSSISVSSYEAESLSDRLTEQAAAGWGVVAVVPAGSQVVAYLSREASGDTTPDAAFADTSSDYSTSVSSDVAPEEAAAEVAAAADVTIDQPASDPVDEAPGWAVTPGAASTSAAGASSPDFTPEPVAAPAAAAAPAGWYADPSARYDLRYWDGSDWTEHVSRNGQQFTDPPIA